MKISITLSTPTRNYGADGNKIYCDKGYIIDIPNEHIPVDVFMAYNTPEIAKVGYIKNITPIRDNPALCQFEEEDVK